MFIDADVGELVEVDSGRRWAPDELRREVARRVGSYQALGMARSDRVLILFGNRLEFFAELLAVWSAGGCAIPVDARLTPFEVATLARTAKARFSVTHGEIEPALRAVLDTMTTVDTQTHAQRAPDGVVDGTQLRLDDDALILFTSGSTGEPKGVVHTHRSLRARWATLRQSLGLGAYSRTLCVLPTHFGHGLICNCLYPWLAGCDLFIAPPFSAPIVMRLGALLDQHAITFMSSVPSLWTLALPVAKPPVAGSLQRIHVGSAPLSADMWRKIQSWAGTDEVFNAYGITETGSWVAGTTGGPVAPEDGLIGEPWGAMIKVLHARSVAALATDASACAPGQSGMIWLNTPALMKGYFQRDDLTAAVVYQDWFMTGDIGALDERGRLVIRGRERDEINKGGMKVFPADIDAVALQFTAVQDVCTFGIDDPLYGENVAMALVLNDDDDATVKGLFDWLAHHLAEHKRPIRWYLLDDIPRTSRGKINRETVREACLVREPLDLACVGGDG